MATSLQDTGRRKRFADEHTARRSRLAHATEARRKLVRGQGRVWFNGAEVGGADPRYAHLEGSHD
jgi:hypothetical protein